MNDRLLKLFWVGVACAVFSVRFDADAATYRFDLPSKTLEGGTMALGENAELVLRNIGTADPAALRTLLCDKEGNYLAASTNGFRASGTSAVGGMSLATAALAARFEGMSALKEIPLVFAVWDTAHGTLLGSSLVQVKNNPLADADGTVPMDWGGVDYGDVAIAQQAYSMATNAWQLSVATSNRMDALHGDYTAATNDLWEAVGGLESGTGALGDRIAALEGADFGGAISSSADSLRDELLDAMESDIEAAFTNGTARGLALSPLDAEAWEESDLAQTPGLYYTVRTNEFGVTIERLLHLVGGVDGVAIAGILAPGGITLPGTFYPLLGRQTWLTVTNWGQITNRYEELYGFTHGNINRLNTFTNDIWRYAQTNRAIATQTRDSLANEKIYRQLRDDDLSNFVARVRSDAQGWRTEETNRLRQLELATNALAGRVATNEAAIAALNTSLGGVDAGSIAQLRADVDAISAQSAATFTNGTARGLAITPIDHRAVYEAGFSSIPGVWATTEYDYLGEPYGHHLLLHGEGTAALDLSSTGIVANADVAAEGFTLGTNTVTDWEVFATAESVTLARQDIERLQEAIANGGGSGGGSGTTTGDIVANSIQMGIRTIRAWTDLTDPLWSGIRNASNALRTAVSGAASKEWVDGQMGELRTDVDDFYDTFAERIDSLQEAIDALDDITDGQTSVNLSSITADIVSLKGATNHIKGNYVKKSGDTITGALTLKSALVHGDGSIASSSTHVVLGNHAKATNANAFVWQGVSGTNYYGSHGPGTFNINPVGGLDGFWIGQRTLSDLIAEQTAWQMGEEGLSVPSLQVGRDLATGNNWAGSADAALAQGVRSIAAGRGAVAAGRQADATNDWAFTWSGAEPEVDWEVFPTRVFEAEEGVPFVLSTNLPYTPTLGGFLGTGDYNEDAPRGWNNGDTVTFVGWKAASGQPETFRYEDGHWYDTDEDGDWTDGNYFTGEEEMDPLFFQCPMVFHGDADHDRANDRFSWVATVQNFKRYGDHGAGTFNVKPVGGLDGFYVGDTTLADAIAGAGVASLNGMGGAVKITNIPPIKVATDTNASKITVSFDDTYVCAINGESGDVTLSPGAGIAIDGTTIENAGVTSISYVSPEAGHGGTYPEWSWTGNVQIGVDAGYLSLRQLGAGNWIHVAQLGGGGGYNPASSAEPPAVMLNSGDTNRVSIGIEWSTNVYYYGSPYGTDGGATTRDIAAGGLARDAEEEPTAFSRYVYTLNLAPAVDSLNGATGALRLLSPSGSQLGVTDGAIRLPEPPNALTAMGEDVLAPVLVVEENSPRITGFEVDEFGDAAITFWGSATTNRLEWLAAEAESEWEPWDMCSWSYSGTTGTVTVVGAEQGAFYRIVVPEGYGTPDRTNVFLVASVPVYLDDPAVPGNRLATLADVQEAVERGGGAAKPPVVTRRAYKDNMSIVPTNGVAWNFANDGVYIADLSVGGWTEETATVTTNEGTVATNTTTVTHPGTMTLNGETIRSWAELATYADGVEFTVETGVESVNGTEGPVRLVAGDNVSIETDTATGAITISATGGGGGGGGGSGSGPWNPNTRVISATNATVLASDYLIWMDSEAAEDEQTILLPDMATDSQSIVIRHLGSDHPTTIVRETAAGTNTYTLAGDGAAVAVDWLGIKTNWYWRQAY